MQNFREIFFCNLQTFLLKIYMRNILYFFVKFQINHKKCKIFAKQKMRNFKKAKQFDVKFCETFSHFADSSELIFIQTNFSVFIIFYCHELILEFKYKISYSQNQKTLEQEGGFKTQVMT